MERAGSSSALDVSTPTQDLKFMLVSNVNVTNFVSVRLAGRSNYRIWKAQMLCLIKSQMLLHIIDAENPFPEDNMIVQYDQLVKGWIFGTMNDHVLNNFVDFNSAREVWMELESSLGQPIRDAEGISSNALDVSARAEDLRYILASNVNVSKFVLVKLSGSSNYDVWKSQMLCLIESHNLLHIIHAKVRFPGDGDPMTQKYDKLVKGWIFDTMSDQVIKEFVDYESVQYLWTELESTFTTSDTEGNSWVHLLFRH
ncbi:hypothetical protein HanPI659440_Chr03g0098981 [Helianthus annuus]|nr:hypothetical protein HanPI659440_Chr03g0098981 [Helianthus annuus]